MDYLQYEVDDAIESTYDVRFKPYYKWITFNTSFAIKDAI